MKLLSLFIVLASLLPVSAQITMDILDHNNTRALIPVKGYFFHDELNGTAGYEVPTGSGDNFIYTLQFNYMAKDQNGFLHASLGQGTAGMGTDVWSGPYSDIHNYDSAYNSYYQDSYWEICQEEIDIYATWWEACNGPNANPTDCGMVTTPSNEILTKIYSWAAHGNFFNGEDYWLFDFYDHPESQMGLYDPDGGDYPIIKGCCASLQVQNDDAGFHTYSGIEPIGIQMNYQFFQYANWGDLNDVTFVEVKIKNYSPINYADFTYGFYVDTDLGDGTDDYIGSDSTRSLFYTYNSSDIDALHGADPAAFGIMALEHPLNSVVLYDNSGTTAAARWNQLNGYDPSGLAYFNNQNQPTKFLYSDNPNSPNGWSEEELANLPGDRRVLVGTNHGPLASGEEIVQTYAILYHRSGTRLENVDGLLNMSDNIDVFYDTIANAQCENGTLNLMSGLEIEDFKMFPNPTGNSVEFTFNGGEADLTCYDMTGTLVHNQRVSSGDRVDVSSWSNGVYLMHVTSEDKFKVVRLEVLH